MRSAWDLHKSGYDYPKLKELGTAHGFVNVQLTKPVGPFDKHLAVDFFK